MSERSAKPAEIPLNPLSFEDALRELETIVARLEQGQVSLEDSIATYERGEFLKKHCEALLKSAELRIEKITLGSDGKPKGVEPLDGENVPF